MALATFKSLHVHLPSNNPNVPSLSKQIEEVSDIASKEWSNQRNMDKMKEDWKPLEFACALVAGKDSYILSGEAIELI